VVWLTGPAEVECGITPRGEGETVLTDLALTDVAAILGLARAYLGNDSGVTQVAAAVRTVALSEPRPEGRGDDRVTTAASRGESPGRTSRPGHAAPAGRATPVVALFGPTDPAVWAPRGEHVRVVRSADGTMDGIAVEQVWEAVREALLSEPRP